jgi:hypothetical protein
MHIQIDCLWTHKGDIYCFTSDFLRWMSGELENRVEESEGFRKNHGVGWTLFFQWDTGRRIKKPRLEGPWIDRKCKEKRWRIDLPWFRYTSPDPKAYVPMLRDFLEQLAAILTREQIDASKIETGTELLLRDFASRPRMIEYGPHPYTFGTPDNPCGLKKKPVALAKPKVRTKAPAKAATKALPKWTIPKRIGKRVEEEDGMWESERFDPILLTVMSGSSFRGREIPLAWQIEFDPFDDRFGAANARLAAEGINHDGDGWSSVITGEFKNRFPELGRELHDDSESSTCVLWVESETACKALVELVWSMLFSR